MDPLTLLIALATFLAVVLFLEGLYIWWQSTRSPEAQRLKKRLDELASETSGARPATLLKQRGLAESATLDRVLRRAAPLRRLDRLLVQSRVPLSVAEFLGWTLALAALGLSLPLLFDRPLPLALAAAAGLACLPLGHVLRARRRHVARFEQQLPEAFDLMGRALRAGHAFPTAVKMVADELKDPIAGEFRILFDEINYGVPQQTALLNLAARTDSTDLAYFVVAVLIQRESGGNLSELLDNISALVRARLKLYGEIRTLSAEGRMSAWILACLPFGAAAVINLVNPGFMQVLWDDPAGIKLVYGALAMMVLGILWMRRIIRIRV